MLIVGLAMALLTYILSVGPVLTIATRSGFGATATSYRSLRAFYGPVFAVAQSSKVGTRLYESYVGIWCRIVLNTGYPKPPSVTPVESLLASVGSITNGQTSFELFVPSELSLNGGPTRQDVAMALIIGKVREHSLFPASREERPGGLSYSFQKVRQWEVEDK